MFDKLWKIIVGIIALSLVVGVIVWLATRETPRKMTPLMHQLSTDASKELAKQLPRRDDVNSVLLLITGPQSRDEQQQFAEMLFDDVIRSAKYDCKTWKDAKKVIDETIRGWLYKKFNLVPGVAPTTMKVAIPVIERLEEANYPVDGVLLVRIKRFDEGPDASGLGAKIEVDAEIYSRTSKKTIKVDPVTREISSAWDRRYLAHVMDQQSIFWRFPVWLIVCCGLPWALIQVVRWILAKRSNGANIALLVALTLVDVGLAWVLLFEFGVGGGTIFGLLVVTLMMGYYNFDATDYIERKLR